MGNGRWKTWAAGLAALAFVGCGNATAEKGSGRPAGDVPARSIRFGMMPKLVGIEYFNQVRKGAEEAARELGVDLVFDGPSSDRVQDQVQMIDLWIAQGFDAIGVAPNDPEVIAPALRRARDAGITVFTWDADANPEASGREVFVNQAPTDEVAAALVDVMAEGIGGEGKTVIVTGSATAPNQNAWMKSMRERLAERYPKITRLETLVPEEDQNRARQLTASVLAAHPDLKGIWGITSVALPGAAEGVRQAGKRGKVFVTGLSLPSAVRQYVKDGTVPKFVLWNPVDHGYLVVHVAKLLREKRLQPGVQSIGRLAGVRVTPTEVIQGPPIIFDKNNIDKYDF